MHVSQSAAIQIHGIHVMHIIEKAFWSLKQMQKVTNRVTENDYAQKHGR